MYYPGVKGFEQLMEDYEYYSQTDFAEDVIIEENPDVIIVDWLKGLELW